MLWSKTASRVRLGLDRDLKGGGSSPCGHPGKILSSRGDEGRAAKQSALGQRTGRSTKEQRAGLSSVGVLLSCLLCGGQY